MSTAQRVSVQEYLKTVYRPDCDFVEGVIEERNLGEFDHSLIQGLISALLLDWSGKHDCFALPEQ